MKTFIVGAIVAFSFTACISNNLIKKEEQRMITNKDKVVELLNSIQTGDAKPVGYINPNKYIQHNLAVKDGLAGFGEVLKMLPKDSAKVEVIRAFEDGDFVFTHTKYNFFGAKAGFDIFRFEEGKIVEHWDTIQEIPEKSNQQNNNGKFKPLNN
jgi:predicted SnoaL-like aldol condensation-catalyzing enzyme